MHRIDHATAAGSLPTPAAAGAPGYFQSGVPGGVPATVVDADWANAVQEELVAVIVAAGVTLDKAARDQLWKAFRRTAGAAVTTITANTTLTADQAGLVLVSAASGNVTVTLPAANAANGLPLRYEFARTDSSANSVTIQRAGSDLLLPGTATSYALAALEICVTCGNGSNGWYQSYTNMLGKRSATITASGTWTPGAWVTRVRSRCWGAGGGGGGGAGSANGWAGTGGGGGGYSEKLCDVTPGTGVTVTVGVGGTAGPATSAGGAGGTTSFGAHHSATGGAGGTYHIISATAEATPGTGVGGDINLTGRAGNVVGHSSVGSIGLGGAGGDAPMGGMGGGPSAGAASPARSRGGGGGGGGGGGSAAGAAGFRGEIQVEF